MKAECDRCGVETTIILRGQVQRYIVPDDQFWRCPVIREQRVRDGETTQECPHLGDAVTREVDTARSPREAATGLS
jgi:hypothetical protein